MIKTFNWEAFGSNLIAVHCKTEKEAIDFCNQSHKHGFDWNNGETRNRTNFWHTYAEETVYYTDSYADVEFTREYYSNRILVEWSDFMRFDTFTKSDLKTGDFVLKRNGSVEMVLLEIGGGVLVLNEDYNCLSDISENLTDNIGYDYDIVAVRRPIKIKDCQFCCFEREYGELVYDRQAIEEEAKKNQVEEMTMEEICQALGKNIKIVKDKEN